MKNADWTLFSDEELLKVRICDLKLRIQDSEIWKYIEEFYSELREKGLVFLPECYFADEWLCPDQEPVIGIPFCLADARLKKLERKMILEVEGGVGPEFMKLIRHEAGHAFNYAYKFYRKRKWTKLFGYFSQEYPDTYIPRPYSKKFVRHIENGYAQYHPDEDFAETFAVWLTPKSNWKDVYNGWKGAFSKLEYVDSLMAEIKGKEPVVKMYKKYWDASQLKQTLGYYYKKKRREYAEDLPGFFDPDLKRIFREIPSKEPYESADKFIGRHRLYIVKSIGMWTGKNRVVINGIVKNLMGIVSGLGLSRYTEEEETLLVLTAYINTLTMNYLFTGRLK